MKDIMPLETAQYISELNTSWPVATDSARQGDDHLRLIKATLKNTFPNITKPVSLTADVLNTLPSQQIPVGGIILWYGTAENVPTGWAICDGRTAPRSDGTGTIKTPDWRDKFILSAGPTYPAASTGGKASSTVESTAAGAHTHTLGSAGAHTHGGKTGDTALTLDQIPAHDHLLAKNGVSGENLTNANTISQETKAGGDTEYRLKGVSGAPDVGKSSSVGGGKAHDHTISSDGAHTHTISGVDNHKHSFTVDTLPPYAAAYYIMKV